MADGVDEVGAVHGVEMELGHAAIDEIEHLLGRDRGGNELAGVDILLEPLESMLQPLRYASARPRREIRRLLEVLHRQDAGHERDVDAARPDGVEIAKVEVVVEEE